MEKESGTGKSGLMWALVGCIGLLVAGLCVATGVGAFFVMNSARVTHGPVTADQEIDPDYEGKPPVGGGVALPQEPKIRMIRATVTAVTGTKPVEDGAICAFTVEEHDWGQPPGYWCRSQVVCGGKLLYGGSSSGYFPCRLTEGSPDVVGEDPDTTSEDTDASIELDTLDKRLSIHDDSSGPHGEYTLLAEVTEVQ